MAGRRHMSTTVIRGARIVTLDQQLGDDFVADIVIEDDKIVTIGDGARAEETDQNQKIIDARDMIAFPGFVDTHRHTWQSAIRHSYADRDPARYFAEVLRGTGAAYTPRDVEIGNTLGTAAALSAGTTTLLDWSHIQNSPAHTDAAISGLRRSGIRAVFGHGYPLTDDGRWTDHSTLPHPDDIRRVHRELLHDSGGLISLAMAARGPEMASEAIWRGDLDLARELDIRTSVHVDAYAHNAHHHSIRQMHEAGVLGPDITFVHCSRSEPDELSMIADASASVSLGVHCEMNSQGIGRIPLDLLIARGIRPSLSGDTETKCSGDMFTQMRMLFGYHRSWIGGGNSTIPAEEARVTLRDILEFATIEGARALGLDSRIGTLSPGKQADIVLIRATDINLAPVADPVAAIVLAAHEGNIDSVFVAGQHLKCDGQLTQIDTQELVSAASQSQRSILQRRQTN